MKPNEDWLSYAQQQQNHPLRPVLKHGPRSLSCMRVRWCETKVRNESETCDRFGRATCTDHVSVSKDSSSSMYGGTRKMVNYA